MLNKKRKKRRNRRWHIHPIYHRRRQYGAYNTLVKELELFEENFFDSFRMSREQFVEMLFMVKNDLMIHYHSRSVIISLRTINSAFTGEKLPRTRSDGRLFKL